MSPLNVKQWGDCSPHLQLYRYATSLDKVELVDVDLAEEFRTDNLLGVTSHHTPAWSEVVWIIDERRHDQRNVRSVHCAGFEEL